MTFVYVLRSLLKSDPSFIKQLQPLTPISRPATETRLFNKKMPVDIIEDENPDWFPKSEKIAKSM